MRESQCGHGKPATSGLFSRLYGDNERERDIAETIFVKSARVSFDLQPSVGIDRDKQLVWRACLAAE